MFKIQTKLLVSYLIVILFTVTSVGFLAYHISTKELIQNTEGFSQALIEQLSINVPNHIKNFEQSTYAMQNDKEFIALVSKAANTESDNQIFINQVKLRTFLSQLIGLDKSIKAVILQPSDGQLYWSEDSEYHGLSGKLNQHSVEEKIAWITRQTNQYHAVQSLWLPSENGEEIIFTRALINPMTLETIGRIAFYLHNDFLQTTPDVHRNVSGTVAVLNRFDHILYANAEAHPVLESWLHQYGEQNPSQTIIQQHDQRYLVFNQQTENSVWRLMFIVPLSELFRTSNQLRFYIIITSSIALLITAMIASGISRQVTQNIRKLERTMRRVEDGDFTVQVPFTGKDEIGLLGRRFNMMLTRINDLIQRLYVEQMAKQQAEFQVLKAQIHPHFLYNTLGSILWLARMNEQPTIAKMVKNLIELLKISVKRTSEYITVQEEISYVDNYLSIQQFRFENRFHINYEVDESIKHVRILSFILQPIVENALLHGIEMSKGNGIINIKAFPMKDQLVLQIQDNGIGMTEEKIEQVLSEESDHQQFPGLHSIGVANVNARIKLYYGEAYGLKYDSQLGRGTTVTIMLPLQTSGVED